MYELEKGHFGTDNYADLVNIDYKDEQLPDGVETTYRVNYSAFTPFLIKGIQEQQVQIETLSSKVSDLETKLEEKETQIAAILARLTALENK